MDAEFILQQDGTSPPFHREVVTYLQKNGLGFDVVEQFPRHHDHMF